MKAWFQRLKVAQKLMLISIVFIIPDSVMLYLFITSVNAQIEFARMEKRGNEYQRPLEDLLRLLPEHRQLAEHASGGGKAEEDALAQNGHAIDDAFDRLEAVDARIGAILQFTDEGLAKRHREHYRARIVRGEWERLKAEPARLSPAETASQHAHLVQDVRMMITHAGDLSNLILDPDLDSYYLMDATLLALPQTQDRLATVIERGEQIIARRTVSKADQLELHTSARLLQEADLDRIVGSVSSALNEDPNFYGISPTLQQRVPPALQHYRETNAKFIQLTEQLVEKGDRGVAVPDYVRAGTLARAASFELWTVICQEMDRLLDTRIAAYQRKRSRSLIVAAMAAMAAFGFVTFITRSISGPLRQQALELRKANSSLEAEIAERKRADAELRLSEKQLAAAQMIAHIGSWEWDPANERLFWSDETFRLHGFSPGAFVPTYASALALVHAEDRALFDATIRRAMQEGEAFRFEHRIALRDGRHRILEQHGETGRGADGRINKIIGTAQDITERKEAEAALQKAHEELLGVSRQAGMAEVATGVLHNVGNVLNSVNVSSLLISERIAKSRITHLAHVSTALRDHADDLGAYLTADPKGSRLPGFIQSLSERLHEEQAELSREAEGLAKNIAHIKEIVSMQQNYAKVSGVIESLAPAGLVEDALELNGAAFTRHGVSVVREFAETPPVRVDKHKVLQILVNVIRNAKYAVSEHARPDKKMTVRIAANGNNRVKIAVSDNGIGIAPENLERIFAHGFTTKAEGHGFGLHSAAIAAIELGGSLVAHSPGLGQGATFTLELPMDVPANQLN